MHILFRGLAVASFIGLATQPASAFVIGDGGPLCAFLSVDCPPEAPAPAAAAPAPVKHTGHHKHKMKHKA